jgi:hypothetical protein
MQNLPRSKKRYLGMTVVQVFVLTCLGLTTIGVIGLTGWMVMRNNPPAAPLPTQISLQDQETAMSLPSRTPFPTYTLPVPTPTFAPTTYESLIPEGWKQYKYAKVELWMPANFVKKSSSGDLVYAENKNVNGNGFIVSIGLTKDTTALTDLDDYIQEGLQKISSETTFLEKKKIQIGTYEAARVKMEVIISSVPAGVAVYFIQDGGTIWTLTCISHYDEFRDWVPIFDQIARTFRINP